MAGRCALAVVIAVLACAPAQGALTHSWHADGDALDAVGSANGTLHDNATFGPGLAGQGFLLDGAADTVTFGDTGDLGTTNFTIAFAIKTTFPGVDEVVLTKRPICDFSSFFDIHEGGLGTLSFEIDGGDESNHKGIGSLDRVDDGVLHTAVFTRQGQVVSVFIDGVASGSDDLGPVQNVDNTSDLVLGSSPCVDAAAAKNFTGVVDELRFADTADPNLLPPPVPVNLTAPSIPASATEGDALTCQPGEWRYHPSSFAFQWLRDGQAIDGATGSTYTATAADTGHSITCRVKGSNAGGEGTADSNALTPAAKPVVTTPPTTTPPPTITPPPPIVNVTPAAVGLPSAKRCVSGRHFAIHLRKVRGEKVSSASVFVKGKRVKTVKGTQITAAIDLRGLPKGKFVVRIVVTTVTGKRFSGKRTYRTCSGRKKAGKHPFAASA